MKDFLDMVRRKSNLVTVWVPVLLSIARESLGDPELRAKKILHLDETKNEHLATLHQAMNVWHDPNAASNPNKKELVVAQLHVYNEAARRGDDEEWVAVWEFDEALNQLKELHRRKMSCPNVDLSIPNRGPYIYEARISMYLGYYVLHPECSCYPGEKSKCPRGVHVSVKPSGESWVLLSPGRTHYMHIENEYGSQTADNASHWTMRRDVSAPIHVVREPLLPDVTDGDAEYGCPGSRDQVLGRATVTIGMLKAANTVKSNAPNPVKGKWCLVKRGHCEITAKVKACLLAGAVGVIVVDHGNFDADNEDQEATVRINYAEGEKPEMIIPVMFVNQAEGQRLIVEATISAQEVIMSAGPSYDAPPIPGYNPGSGLTVYDISAGPDGPKKEYPDLFPTVGWLEVSDLRDILFVCLPEYEMIVFLDVSKPMESIESLSGIQVPCSRSGTHDYHIFEYMHDSGYYTVLIDPIDRGNKLYYFETTNPREPKFIQEIHAFWEHERDGMGQVRTGGLGGRYQVITWHCSDLYCGKNHGDSLYVLDSHDLKGAAKKIPLPLSKGAFARDIACDGHGICLATLTWDGAVALDLGVTGSKNQFKIIASQVEGSPFGGADIPFEHAWLRMHSGAQKVYASSKFKSVFYVEHADFSMGPLRLGNVVNAIELNEVWRVSLENYDPTIEVKQLVGATEPVETKSKSVPAPSPSEDLQSDQEGALLEMDGGKMEDDEDIGDEPETGIGMGVIVALVGVSACFAIAAVCLLLRAKATIRKQRAELLARQQDAEAQPVRPITEATSGNVVLGRPVEEGTPEAGATHGEPLPGTGGAKGTSASKPHVQN